jgi:RNA ligase (TIGR02306 family)
MTERKMASIQKVAEIKSINGADAIEACRINGWWVVAKKGEFTVGDLVVYFEIDSWIPHDLAPFLSKGNEPKEYNGVKGERLRTVKLRGQISQGLILPISILTDMNPEYSDGGYVTFDNHPSIRLFENGADVSIIMGIQKYEPPISTSLAGQVVGHFPTQYAPKTDQERIQNCFDELPKDHTWEVSMKLDGSSFSLMKIDGGIRPCSRNLELKNNEENANNVLVKLANQIATKIQDVDNIVIQMESMGEGIQGNKEKLSGHHAYVFDIYDPTEQRYFSPSERVKFCDEHGLIHTPILHETFSIDGMTIDDILEMADGPSINAKYREGIVFKSHSDPSVSFKAISNKWLLKNGE